MLKLWLPEKFKYKVELLKEAFNGKTRRMWIREHNDLVFKTFNLEPQEVSKFYAYISGRKPVKVRYI